jgi:D-alanyl-D-alanine carboxypeptidase/D-alanyl-D-alanine-endopeptidase (penicillin-binding protein 4)
MSILAASNGAATACLRILATIAVAWFAIAPPAAAKKPPRATTEAESADISDEMLSRRYRIPLAEVGYLVIDAKTGEVLEQRQAKETFAPASTIKVASSVAALVVLGAEHRFTTDLLAVGTITNGALAGDLYLKGGGDPMLTSDELEGMAQQLKARGITSITGRFVYDSSAYTTAREIDANYEEGASYNPGIAALSVNFNVLALKWGRSKNGASFMRLVAQAEHEEIAVDYLKALPARPGTTGRYGVGYSEDGGTPTWFVLTGRRAAGEVRVPVKRPDFSTAYVFRQAAAKHGVALPEPVAGIAPETATLFARQVSKPLPEIVHRTLRFSNNMAAELLGLAAARQLAGKPLDLRGSAAVVGDWLKQKIAGFDGAGLDLRNNSGLTRDSKISPEQMVAILRYAQKLQIGGIAFPNLLRRYHVGKIDAEDEYGTAENGQPEGKEKNGQPRTVMIKAKTGTVNFSRGVVGYMHSAHGRDVIFAVFVSNLKQREVAEKNGHRWTEPPVYAWLARSREFQRALVKRWAEKL